jgi:hypothetical protein
MVCHILLESSQQGLQLCFRPHLNQRFSRKLWASKVIEVPTVGILRLPLGSPGTKWHLGASPMARHRVYYKGEGGGFPQVRAMVSLVNLNLHVARPCTKVLQLCITNLLFSLCRSMWVIELFVNLPSPILELQHAPLPPKCCKSTNVPQLILLPLFSPLGSQLSPSISLGVRHNVISSSLSNSIEVNYMFYVMISKLTHAKDI